ncbi:MAG: YbhB/YbcL family Raf kinase inhibitor-like protein [bacterium]
MKRYGFVLIGLAALTGCQPSPSSEPPAPVAKKDETVAPPPPTDTKQPDSTYKVMASSWKLTSDSVQEGQEVPETNKGDGAAPTLHWTAVKEGTKSVAVIMDDPDAPGPEPYVHWLVSNVGPEGEASGWKNAVTGNNSRGEPKYYGPKPPSGTHHYHFKVYALDTTLTLKQGFTKSDLLSAMKGHVLDQTELVAVSTAP